MQERYWILGATNSQQYLLSELANHKACSALLRIFQILPEVQKSLWFGDSSPAIAERERDRRERERERERERKRETEERERDRRERERERERKKERERER